MTEQDNINFLNRILDRLYTDWRKSRHGELTEDALLVAAERVYYDWREHYWTRIFNSTMENVPKKRLQYLYPKLAKMIEDGNYGLIYYFPADNDEEKAVSAAEMIATFRLWHLERTGRFPRFTLDWFQVHKYLAEKRPMQKELFKVEGDEVDPWRLVPNR